MQQILFKYLLCTNCSSRHWGYKNEKSSSLPEKLKCRVIKRSNGGMDKYKWEHMEESLSLPGLVKKCFLEEVTLELKHERTAELFQYSLGSLPPAH